MGLPSFQFSVKTVTVSLLIVLGAALAIGGFTLYNLKKDANRAEVIPDGALVNRSPITAITPPKNWKVVEPINKDVVIKYDPNTTKGDRALSDPSNFFLFINSDSLIPSQVRTDINQGIFPPGVLAVVPLQLADTTASREAIDKMRSVKHTRGKFIAINTRNGYGYALSSGSNIFFGKILVGGRDKYTLYFGADSESVTKAFEVINSL
jgi:hypothetical protein